MKKIGICTLFTGYNYGSALQAYALSKKIEELGYKPEILKLSGSIISGKDVRIKKMIVTLCRMFLYSKNKKNVIKSFKQNNKNVINSMTIKKFDNFYKNEISPKFYTYKKLKKEAQKDDYYKFVCGSDQIWNSTAFYVDPFYYLKFAPLNKRISYAPSFGREFIPKYNRNIIKRNLREIKYISIREDSGKKMIKELINKDAQVCLDPTFLISKNEWIKYLKLEYKENNEKYIFLYFLSKPKDKVINFVKKLAKEENIKIVSINQKIMGETVCGGPKEFLNYMLNAEYIITDSFHGVAFSLNFAKKFYVFDRQYVTENQSTRIKSILRKFDNEKLFEPNEIIHNDETNEQKINEKLNMEKQYSIKFLKKALEADKNE